MSKTAILFPGQGSQTPEMRDDVERDRPDLLELVTEIVGEDPFPKAEEGTNYAQPAIFCASLAGWDHLGRPDADFMAGHSLGELAALVAAGSLEERDGLELVALRGRLMQESGEAAGDGGMLALLGRGAADHAAELAEAHGLSVANDNSPQQVVLSGAKQALPEAADAAKELSLRAIELSVSGAFHSPMMTSNMSFLHQSYARPYSSPPGPGSTKGRGILWIKSRSARRTQRAHSLYGFRFSRFAPSSVVGRRSSVVHRPSSVIGCAGLINAT